MRLKAILWLAVAALLCWVSTNALKKKRKITLRPRTTPYPPGTKLSLMQVSGKHVLVEDAALRRAMNDPKESILEVTHVRDDEDLSKYMNGPEKPRSEHENAAISYGIEDIRLIKSGALNAPKARVDMLCVAFIQATLDPLIVLHANMIHMKNRCDWAIVIYGGSDDYENIVCNNNAVSPVANVIHCKLHSDVAFSPESIERCSNGTNLQFNFTLPEYRKNIPKSVLYLDLLPYLKNYRKVMLMDEDISLVGFDVDQALQIWDCAFNPPPLIVQPTIYESRQYYSFLGKKSWESKNLYASASGLVEQQVPMFSAVFFEWFLRRVVNQTNPCASELGVDWGVDRTWCGAARAFGEDVLGWPNYSHPCAILTGVPAVHHLDTRSIKSKRSNPLIFRMNGNLIVEIYERLFPSWMNYNPQEINPLDPSYGFRYSKKSSLIESCVTNPKANCVFPYCY